ncbi:transport and Golgi organization protein 2 [Taibaiella chishuiensis]|uniref:Transport and Golgi organization protein 2 n=2 Tax=Taibaiella chishuiensis TaxID=1434707 RepID=A0A2P8D1M9_9BACT|nr:transport and Golgi organization protein 2 [Taibaiella chishuiensis]
MPGRVILPGNTDNAYMCTVTFIKTSDKVFITSNRDELALRPAALPPAIYGGDSGRIIFPKDGLAGGTWMALHERGNAMVLLNGAFERHIHKPPYRLSRGLIFLQIFDSATPVFTFQQIDLDQIEPFTLVIWQQHALWEARWDGANKTWRPMPDDVMHIWSSATLYDEEVRHKREAWFDRWQAASPVISTESIEQFHTFAGEGDAATDLRMNRDGLLQTVSISNITISDTGSIFRYNDLLQGGFYTQSFQES